jgi:hypothetical protein
MCTQTALMPGELAQMWAGELGLLAVEGQSLGQFVGTVAAKLYEHEGLSMQKIPSAHCHIFYFDQLIVLEDLRLNGHVGGFWLKLSQGELPKGAAPQVAINTTLFRFENESDLFRAIGIIKMAVRIWLHAQTAAVEKSKRDIRLDMMGFERPLR